MDIFIYIIWICLFIYLLLKLERIRKLEDCLDILYPNIIIFWIYFEYIYIYYLNIYLFIYLFIILKLERIGKLNGYYGEDWKIGELFGYITFKYNYLDIFWIYLYILFRYVYLFIYYNKIGENWKIEDQLLFWIYYIQI